MGALGPWLDRQAEKWWVWVVLPLVIAALLTCVIWLVWG